MNSNHSAWFELTFCRCLALAAAAWTLLGSWQAGAVGSWVPLTSLPPKLISGHMILLSDGTVMVQNGLSPGWSGLIPKNGSYINGTWTNLPSMTYPREFYASVVLTDGRVLVAGGEHPDVNGDPQKTNYEIYNPDPRINHWTKAEPAPANFSDSESIVLPDGTVIVHPRLGTNSPSLVMHYFPLSDSWVFGATNTGSQDETTWVKLPDDSIITVNDSTQNSERYIPALDQWIKDKTVPVSLFSNGETGAGLLLPDGRAFFLGASGHTALYTGTGTTNEGSWAIGPDIPNSFYTDDAPAAMMVNGRVLCAVGDAAPNAGSPAPTWFFEYDYKGQTTNLDGTINPNGIFYPTGSPGNPTIGSSYPAKSASLYFLDLPDGNILFSDSSASNGQLYVYQPDLPLLAAGKPTLKSVRWSADGSLHLGGTLFNGISQGASFGDDAQQDSNYPLVRFADSSGNTNYGRTYNWSSTSVRTGKRIVTTEATLPAAVADSPGTYSLQVVANGIASDPVTFQEPVWVDFNYTNALQLGTYPNPFPTLAQGVKAVSSGGTIAFKANVQPSISREIMTISKPMNLIAVGGPATVGQK